MLELRLDEATGIYAAADPDEGQQRCDWWWTISAASSCRRASCSTAGYVAAGPAASTTSRCANGVKFQIPFETMVVFATNLDPRELADERFCAALQNKVYVEAVEPAVVRRHFQAGGERPEHALRAGYRGVTCASSATAKVARSCELLSGGHL